MDSRHLRRFVVLAETLNFRRASEKYHMFPASAFHINLKTGIGGRCGAVYTRKG
jgi:hypothetical protein